MDTKLLDILACPVCKGPLKLSADKTELIAKAQAWRIRSVMASR